MIQVFCSHSEMVPIAKLVPNPRNPNRHPESQIKALARVIEGNGWRQPITVSKRSGFVVKGHGRLLAAQQLGLSEVPVDFQDYDTEAAEWADLIADNRLAELSEMDSAVLRDLLEELDTGDFDMDLTGFDAEALEALMTAAGPGPEVNLDPGEDRYSEQYGVIVICENEAHQRDVFTDLSANGYNCKVVTT